MMGFRKPENRMMQYANTENPAELVNAYVDKAKIGRGIGRALFEKLKFQAKLLGYTELIWNSGSRYKDSAWAFYDSLVGVEKVATVDGYYVPGKPTRIWRIAL